MPEMHWRQPRFMYSASATFTKNKEQIKKFKETWDSRYIYLNELDKACFQHDMAYGNFKDLNRRTFADNILHDKAFNIVKDPKYDGYQKSLVSMIYKFFDRKTSVVVLKMTIFLIKNYQKNYTNQLLESSIKERFTHLLLTTFGLQM